VRKGKGILDKIGEKKKMEKKWDKNQVK